MITVALPKGALCKIASACCKLLDWISVPFLTQPTGNSRFKNPAPERKLCCKAQDVPVYVEYAQLGIVGYDVLRGKNIKSLTWLICSLGAVGCRSQ